VGRGEMCEGSRSNGMDMGELQRLLTVPRDRLRSRSARTAITALAFATVIAHTEIPLGACEKGDCMMQDNLRINGNTTEPWTTDLAFVTEDVSLQTPVGCDAISVVDLESRSVSYQGPQAPSPGRLAIAYDAKTVFATRTNGIIARSMTGNILNHDIYATRWISNDVTATWQSTLLMATPRVTPVGGIAVSMDSEYLYLSTQTYVAALPGESCDGGAYSLSRYRITEIDWANLTLGPRRGYYHHDSPFVEIMLSKEQNLLHAVSVPSTPELHATITPKLVTLDADRMTVVSATIQLPSLGPPGIDCSRGRDRHPLALIHSTLTPDERFMLVTRGTSGAVVIVDLRTRETHTQSLGGFTRAGGIAFNDGWVNEDVLAVHGHDTVGLFRWHESTNLDMLGSIDIEPRTTDIPDIGTVFFGPIDSLAWNMSGSQLIVAVSGMGPYEFAVMEVSEEGAHVKEAYTIEVCKFTNPNFPNDVATFNGIVEPTLSPTSDTHPTATATRTSEPTSTARPTNTFTPQPSTPPTSTLSPSLIWLPSAQSSS